MTSRTATKAPNRAASLRQQIAPGIRVAFVSGKFNVVHPGHLRLLRFARESADVLVVGVLADGDNSITLPADLRLDAVQAIGIVDHAFLLEESVEDCIRLLCPDVVVKGKEYAERENAEQGAVDSYGGKLLFSSGEISFSSLNLLQREYFETDFSSIRKPTDYPERHQFSIRDLRHVLAKFSGMKVLVIGDLIVDTYVTCDPLGMSQEDPTIVVTPIEEKTFVGGAGIVAAHASGLGAEVQFISICGQDESAAFAAKALAGYGVQAELFYDNTRPTTHKKRYRAHNKTLLRVNVLRQHAADQDIADAMVARASACIKNADIVLFSDFNYGCLPQGVVDALVEKGLEHRVMMGADSQASSQLADISRFRDMDLITPTEREARLALHDSESGLVVVAERLQQVGRAQNLIITLGAEGLLCYGRKGGEFSMDRLPAFNTAPKDVAGAGDSLFTSVALALRSGADIWRSVYVGGLAAACQVSRVGNTPLTRQDLDAEIAHETRL
jgi:rfaE bifunctional protein kinase chain/domain